MGTGAGATSTQPAAVVARLTVVAPLDAASPYGRGTVLWGEVLHHLADKLAWHNTSYHLSVHPVAAAVGGGAGAAELAADLAASQIAVVIGLPDAHPASAALPSLLASAGTPNVVALGSGAALRATVTRLAGREVLAPRGLLASLAALLPGSPVRHDAEVLASVEELYGRHNSEDLLFSLLVLVNEHVAEVPLVANSAKSKNAGLDALKCMLGNCGTEIFKCYADTSCRAALDCLNSCKFNDQVCSYRCIASYESPQLAAFSLCILQKHNCLGLTAERPTVPDPAPLASFRGQPLTHEVAEDVFIGWLDGASAGSRALPSGVRGESKASWVVFSGKNPAYDAFPCQHQLFYRGQARGSLWYDPVFAVQTVDGRKVWRSRHYRVRRGSAPGTFHLSVLDNGVTSLEYWKILDCHEGLEWCVFHYTGAAAAAGASYAGAILASPTGAWPQGAEDLRRIDAALEHAGIKRWELSNVDNSDCAGAPLAPLAPFGSA